MARKEHFASTASKYRTPLSSSGRNEVKAPAAYLMRSASVIADLAPELQVPATRLLRHSYEAGIPLVVASGKRTGAAQKALYAQGRTSPGAVVTNVRPGSSLHETGRAFDVAPLDPLAPGGMGDVVIPWPTDPVFWRIIGAIGEDLGLVWGGRFPVPDYPHFEAP